MSELFKRTIVAFLGMPLIIGASFWGGLPFLFVITVISLLCLREFYLLAQAKGLAPFKTIGFTGLLLVLADVFFFNATHFVPVITLFVLCVMVIELFHRTESHLVNISVTIFGVLYIGLFSFFLKIRGIDLLPEKAGIDGGMLVVLMFLGIWACDTGAYFIGKTWGKFPLYQHISPKKTWIGALGGLGATIIVILLFRQLLVPAFPLIFALTVSMIIGITAQISDLVESMLKRDADIKDSSSI